MPKLRVHNFSISLDGFGAGLNQSREKLAGYECVEFVNASGVAHVRLARSSTGGG